MEANRESAIDALTKARAKKDAGDHASAVRLAEKSLRICKTEEAQAFLDFLVKFGPGSEAAKAIDRVLQAADHYAVLDVAPDADAPAVKRAYQQRALKIHPDKNHAAGAQQAFQRLNEAHNTLSDPAKRREYDLKRPAASGSAAQAGPAWGAAAGWHSKPQPQPRPGAVPRASAASAGGYRQPRPAGASSSSSSSSSGGGPGGGRGAGSAADRAAEAGRAAEVQEVQRENAVLRQQVEELRQYERRAVQLSQALNQEQLQRRREEQDHREQIARWTALQRSWTNKTSETERALHERDEEVQRLRRTTENDRIELEALRRSHASAASRRAAVEARLESEVAATGELHQICDALRKQLAAQARPGVAGGTSPAAAGPSSDLAAAGASSQGGGRLGLPEEMVERLLQQGQAELEGRGEGKLAAPAGAALRVAEGGRGGGEEEEETGAPRHGPSWRLELRPLAPEPVAAAGGQDPRRPIRLPLGKINEAVVVGRSSREHANSFEINDPLVSRKHVRIDTKAWPVPEQGVRGEDVIAVATALGANPIGVRHHADDSVEKADRGETLNLFHGDVLALLAADNAHPARYEYSVVHVYGTLPNKAPPAAALPNPQQQQQQQQQQAPYHGGTFHTPATPLGQAAAAWASGAGGIAPAAGAAAGGGAAAAVPSPKRQRLEQEGDDGDAGSLRGSHECPIEL